MIMQGLCQCIWRIETTHAMGLATLGTAMGPNATVSITFGIDESCETMKCMQLRELLIDYSWTE